MSAHETAQVAIGFIFWLMLYYGPILLIFIGVGLVERVKRKRAATSPYPLQEASPWGRRILCGGLCAAGFLLIVMRLVWVEQIDWQGALCALVILGLIVFAVFKLIERLNRKPSAGNGPAESSLPR